MTGMVWLWAAAALALLGAPALAQTTEGPASGATAAPAGDNAAASTADGEGAEAEKAYSAELTWEEPLARFLSRDEPIYLPNSNSGATVYLPLSPRMEVTSAVLHLEYTNSIALLEDRSVLRISLGDSILAQLPLKRSQPDAVLDIRLPVDLLEPGYNPLNFWVAQHYTVQCEDPSAPELWTQIDHQRSTITFTGRWRETRPTLSMVEDLVDARLATDYQITIVTASGGGGEGGAFRDRQLSWGSVLSQGFALRLRYQPLEVYHATSLQAAVRRGVTDTVVVGTQEEVERLLGASLPGLEGPYLAVRPLPGEATRFLLIVSGRDDDEVSRAVEAFAYMRLPLPDAPYTTIGTTDAPAWPEYSARFAVRPGGRYPFNYFDYQSTTMQGISAASLELPVWVPPDLFTRESSMVEISLHFAYGAGLRRDSVLNIFLNGRFERVIHLRDENGGVYQDYKVYIPLRSFRGGMNTLAFTPRMMPLITGECEAVQDQNLLLTIFDDSVLNLPEASHYVAMPDLGLFSRAGFPLAVNPSGEDDAVMILGDDSETIAAAWMVLAKLAQVVSRPLTFSEVTFSQPPDDRNVLVVGPAGLLPGELAEGSPVTLEGNGPSTHPTAVDDMAGEEDQGFFSRLFGGRLRLGPPSMKTYRARIVHDGSLGRSIAALQYESPRKRGRSVTAFLAASPERLHQGMRQAVTTGIWDGLTGGLTVWEDGSDTPKTFNVSDTYHVGDLSTQARLEYYFSRNPWFWTLLLVVLMVLFALLTLLLLRRYKAREIGEVDERHPDDEWTVYEDEERLDNDPVTFARGPIKRDADPDAALRTELEDPWMDDDRGRDDDGDEPRR